MKNLVMTFLPNSIKKSLASYYSRIQAIEEDQHLRKKAVELTTQHLKNLRVLTERTELLKCLPKNAIVTEVGVAEGGFSEQILNICQPKKLHLIDLWGSSDPGYGEVGYSHVTEKFKKLIDVSQVIIHRGLSWDMLNQLPDEYLDWIYIDAGHSYDTVRKDLQAAKDKLKKDGIISGHDYARWYIPFASRYGKVERYGVVEAVNEFCVTYNYEMIYLTHESHGYLSYAIKKM